MEKQVKKILWYSFITMTLVFLILLGVWFKGGGGNLGMALPTTLWQRSDLLGTNASPYSFASTTVLSLSVTATSTLSVDYIYDTLSLNIKIVNASSTKASAFTITPLYSNDPNCHENAAQTSSINWFAPIDVNTNYLNSNQLATTTTAAAGKTVRYKYTIRDLATQCIRFVFTDTNASSTAWVEALLK